MGWINFLSNKRVAILVGHLDKDSGAVDPVEAEEHDGIDTEEVDLNIAFAKALYAVVAMSGGHCWMLGGSLRRRAEDANSLRPDVAVSIHNNAGPPTARGDEVLWSREVYDDGLSITAPRELWADRLRLAETVESRLAGNLPEVRSRGVKERNDLYVLKAVTACPVVLVECGFISNPDEERTLWDEGYRLRWASEMAVAIRDFAE